MPAIFIAIAILLTKLVPLAGPLALLIIGAIVGELTGASAQKAPAYLGFLALLITYLPGAIVSFLFIHFYRLKAKLPKPIPGLTFLLLGIVLAIAEQVALFLPSVVGGLQRSHMALQLVRMAAWLSVPLLLVGVVMALLAARGTKPPSHPAPNGPNSEANVNANL